jgi:hypothetical protein
LQFSVHGNKTNSFEYLRTCEFVRTTTHIATQEHATV